MTLPYDRLVGLYDRVLQCRQCGLHATATKRALDRDLALYFGYGDVELVIVGMAPAYCEDRTGSVLVGGQELIASRCGFCRHVAKCFGYFLHLTESYKDFTEPCRCPEVVTEADMLTPDQISALMPRLRQDFHSERTTRQFDPRTAGEILDWMLAESGWIRGSAATIANGGVLDVPTADELTLPTCATINLVQCWSCERVDGVVQNRPPHLDEVQACSAYVHEFIDIVQPKGIIALGGDVLSALTELVEPKISKYIGTPVPYAANPSLMVYPLYHPSFHLHRFPRLGVANHDALLARWTSDVMREITLLRGLRDNWSLSHD